MKFIIFTKFCSHIKALAKLIKKRLQQKKVKTLSNANIKMTSQLKSERNLNAQNKFGLNSNRSINKNDSLNMTNMTSKLKLMNMLE